MKCFVAHIHIIYQIDPWVKADFFVMFADPLLPTALPQTTPTGLSTPSRMPETILHKHIVHENDPLIQPGFTSLLILAKTLANPSFGRSRGVKLTWLDLFVSNKRKYTLKNNIYKIDFFDSRIILSNHELFVTDNMSKQPIYVDI